MTNTNVLIGYACPKCKAEEPFHIDGSASFLRVDDDGCDEFEGLEWSDLSFFTCCSCGHIAQAKDFKHD